MYRHCIYCSADLGANETLEAFPVGRTVAFDAAKGRLWAVCPKCARWNLAPLEERWEAVEEAEQRFAITRLRVQAENIGVARAADGMRLVRIGAALPGELAAWRYGGQFLGRRYLAVMSADVALNLVAAGLEATGIFAPTWMFWRMGRSAVRSVLGRRPVYELPAAAGAGGGLRLQRRHVAGLWVDHTNPGELRLSLPEAPDATYEHPLSIGGGHALRVLERTMPMVNRRGARQRVLEAALDDLERAGTRADFIRAVGARPRTLLVGNPREHRSYRLTPEGKPLPLAEVPPRLGDHAALALEMALHEEQERRALEGELTLLQSAWREAEEIAAIADRLAASAEAG